MKMVKPLVLALLAGIALALLASVLTTRKDPFDAPSYWWFVYPLSIAACAFLGSRYPARPAVWSIVLFEGQYVGSMLRSGEISNLWPLGMTMLAVIAIPGIYAARFAARRSKGETG